MGLTRVPIAGILDDMTTTHTSEIKSGRWYAPADCVPPRGSIVVMETIRKDAEWTVGMIVDTNDTEWTYRKLSRDKRSLTKSQFVYPTRQMGSWQLVETTFSTLHKLDPGYVREAQQEVCEGHES